MDKDQEAKKCPRCQGPMRPFVHIYSGPPEHQTLPIGGGMKCDRCHLITEYDSNRKCVVCDGQVVPDTYIFHQEIYHPENKSFKEVDKDYYCRQCGLKYRFPPPEKPTQPA